jgi:hypothetical protein
MLSASREYTTLDRLFKGASLAASLLSPSVPSLIPPMPLAPFCYTVIGRLSSLHVIDDTRTLIGGIKAVNVKVSIKKAQVTPQPSIHPSGNIMEHDTIDPSEIDLDIVATAAENPFWLSEIERNANLPCRYLFVQDELHPNSYTHTHTYVYCVCARACVCVCVCSILGVCVCVCVCV